MIKKYTSIFLILSLSLASIGQAVPALAANAAGPAPLARTVGALGAAAPTFHKETMTPANIDPLQPVARFSVLQQAQIPSASVPAAPAGNTDGTILGSMRQAVPLEAATEKAAAAEAQAARLDHLYDSSNGAGSPEPVSSPAETGTASLSASRLMASAPSASNKPSRWYDRLLVTTRRTSEAYGAVIGFWSGLASGKLSGEEARKALRETALMDYAAAVRSPDADPTLLDMREAMVSANLEIPRILALLNLRSGLQHVASTNVSVNKEHQFSMHYGANGGFRGSNSSTTSGKTFVYSVDIYQAPGATPDSPALVRIVYSKPGFIRVGKKIGETSYKGLSASDGLYLVKSLSSLGEAGRLSGGTDKVLGDDTVGDGLAALVTALDEAKSPFLRNDASGYGEVGTSYSFKVSDPASSLELNEGEWRELRGRVNDEDSERESMRRQVSLLGTYIARRFQGEDVAHRPAPAPRGTPWGRILGLGTLGLGAILLPGMLTAATVASLVLHSAALLATFGTVGVLATAFGPKEPARFHVGFGVLLGVLSVMFVPLAMMAIMGSMVGASTAAPLLAALLSSSDLALTAAAAAGLAAASGVLAGYVRLRPAFPPRWSKILAGMLTPLAALAAGVGANIAAGLLLPHSALLVAASSWALGPLPWLVALANAPLDVVLVVLILGTFAVTFTAAVLLTLYQGLKEFFRWLKTLG